MKLSIILPFAFLSVVFGPVRVTADRVITFLFNNNSTGPISGLHCNDADRLLIAPIFNISSYQTNRRMLRSGNSLVTAIVHTDDTRGLTTTTNTCRNRCAGYVGYCPHMSNCHGPRRALQQFHPLYATCSSHLAEMNSRIDQLIATSTMLTDGCKLLIGNGNRDVTCEDGIAIGEISGFKITGIRYTEIINERCRGYPVEWCPYATSPKFTQSPIAMEVVSNEVTLATKGGHLYVNIEIRLIPCFTTLELSIVGPNLNQNKTLEMLSDSSLNIKLFSSNSKVVPGRYTIKAVPNNNIEKAKSFTLIVN